MMTIADARCWLARKLEHAAGWLDPHDNDYESLAEACQIFAQGLGDETAYYPTLGAPATANAIALMRKAGVEPRWYDQRVWYDGEEDDDNGEEDES